MSEREFINSHSGLSWLDIPDHSDFSIFNIPFGVFKTKQLGPRCATAIGPYVVDLFALAGFGYLKAVGMPHDVLSKPHLNDLIGLGKSTTSALRRRLIELFSQENQELQNNTLIHQHVFLKHEDVEMLMPVHVGDYTDFYSSKEHATNVGAMFRDPNNALLPNWKHLPVAYHGRASSIVVSGTPLKRPQGQFRGKDDPEPIFGPTRALDFELEVGFVIGKNSSLGESISVEKAEDHIFGFLLFNDWSARDIQSWEYVPLGPFLSKNFMSSVSPWIVTIEAMDPFRTKGPLQEVQVLPYLSFQGDKNYDVSLEVYLQPEGGAEQCISRSNFRYMYWNVCQQLAHHTVNGCNIAVGDIMASGTISGPERGSVGSMLELTRQGREPITLADKSERKYLLNGDTVTFKGFAVKDNVRVGFGEVKGKIVS